MLNFRNLFIVIFVLAMVFGNGQNLWAQEPDEPDCVVLYPPNMEKEPPSGYGDPDILNSYEPTTGRRVLIAAHIVRSTNGTGGISSNDINTALTQLNNAFTSAKIEFILDTTDYIDNDSYFELTKSEWESLANINFIPRRLNIYFVPRAVGFNGIAYLRDRRCAVTNAAAINGSTLPHEVGHNFFLYHTHGHPGHEQELVNGSNCRNAGDLLCDTPAEPYNDDNGISGYVYANTCQYFGTFRDQNNELFTPDTRNFMGYAPANCRNRFSNQQINKMNQTLSTYLYDLLTIPVTVTNRIGTNNAGGTLTINNQLVASGGSIELEADVMHLGKTNHERLQGNNKHKNWDEDNAQYRLQEAFEAKRERPARDAYFVGLNPVIITTQLIETSIAGGYVEFRDPWYLADASNNQPNQFLRYSVPFSPTGAYNQNTGGVFLNQGLDWQPPYYSIRVASVQNIELPHTGRVHQFYFQGWIASPRGSAKFKNADELETPVVFKQEGATVSANYKGSILKDGLHLCLISELSQSI